MPPSPRVLSASEYEALASGVPAPGPQMSPAQPQPARPAQNGALPNGNLRQPPQNGAQNGGMGRLQPIGGGQPVRRAPNLEPQGDRDPWGDLNRLGVFLTRTLQQIVRDDQISNGLGITINLFGNGSVIVTIADYADQSQDPDMIAARPEPPAEGEPPPRAIPVSQLGNALYEVLADVTAMVEQSEQNAPRG